MLNLGKMWKGKKIDKRRNLENFNAPSLTGPIYRFLLSRGRKVVLVKITIIPFGVLSESTMLVWWNESDSEMYVNGNEKLSSYSSTWRLVVNKSYYTISSNSLYSGHLREIDLQKQFWKPIFNSLNHN